MSLHVLALVVKELTARVVKQLAVKGYLNMFYVVYDRVFLNFRRLYALL